MVGVCIFLQQPLMTLNKSFCGGPGGSFLEKRPLVAEGKTINLTVPETLKSVVFGKIPAFFVWCRNYLETIFLTMFPGIKNN